MIIHEVIVLKLFKNKNFIFSTAIILILPLIFFVWIHVMKWMFGWSTGTTDGWLGFLGAYFGAMIAIGGVYWQVKKQIDIDKLNKKESKRSKINIQKISKLNDGDELYYKPIYSIELNEYPKVKQYVSKKDLLPEGVLYNRTRINAVKIINCTKNPIISCKIDYFYKYKNRQSLKNDYSNAIETLMIPFIKPFESVYVDNFVDFYFGPLFKCEIGFINISYVTESGEINELEFSHPNKNQEIIIPTTNRFLKYTDIERYYKKINGNKKQIETAEIIWKNNFSQDDLKRF